MSVDYTAVCTFGVKLTQEQVTSIMNKGAFDEIDDILYEKDTDEYNEFLEVVRIGSAYGGDVDLIISAAYYGATYSAKEFNPLDNGSEALGWLEKVCNNYSIDFKPKWYIGIYQD